MSSAILAQINVIRDIYSCFEITRINILDNLETAATQAGLEVGKEEPASHFAVLCSSKMNILLLKA
jgi:hypothetical protein